MYRTLPEHFKPAFEVVGCFFEYERSEGAAKAGYERIRPQGGCREGGVEDAAKAGYEGNMLLLHRNVGDSQGDKWGVPAGKVERGEMLISAMVREIEEETGYKTQRNDISYFDTVYVEHPEGQFVYHMFSLSLQRKPDIIINPQEHQAFVWISPLAALSLPLVADLDECIKRFYEIP